MLLHATHWLGSGIFSQQNFKHSRVRLPGLGSELKYNPIPTSQMPSCHPVSGPAVLSGRCAYASSQTSENRLLNTACATNVLQPAHQLHASSRCRQNCILSSIQRQNYAFAHLIFSLGLCIMTTIESSPVCYKQKMSQAYPAPLHQEGTIYSATKGLLEAYSEFLGHS